jgi:hypothetical protein
MNLWTGHRLFLVRQRQRAGDFQAFLWHIHRHYRSRHVVLVQDEDPSHTAHGSVGLAGWLGIHYLLLPKRSPQLNPVDTLWGQAKDTISANKQYATIQEHVHRFLAYVSNLSNEQALDMSGVYSGDFWLQEALCNYFCGPA